MNTITHNVAPWWEEYRGKINDTLIEFIESESRAIVMRHFQPLIIPSLLQTPRYTREIIQRLMPDASEQLRDDCINVRVKRQSLTALTHGPIMHFIIGESALYRVNGDNHVMNEQLRHLVTMANQTNVTIEILLFTAGFVPGIQAPMVLHQFDDGDDELLLLEAFNSDKLIRDADRIAEARLAFDALSASALSPIDSLQLLRDLVL